VNDPAFIQMFLDINKTGPRRSTRRLKHLYMQSVKILRIKEFLMPGKSVSGILFAFGSTSLVNSS